MKKKILILTIAGSVSLFSCENGNTDTERGVDVEYSDSLDNQSQNSTGYDQNATGTSGSMDAGDTLGTPGTRQAGSQVAVGEQGQVSQGWENVPQVVRDKLQNDNNFSNSTIKENRRFTRDGRTFYELTFEGNANNRIVMDELGNRMADDNR